MEIRKDVKFVILKINQFELSKIAYIKILNSDTVESIKINRSLKSYKFTHLLKPSYILTADLVKTRKNWILNEITNFSSFVPLESFKDFESFVLCIGILNKYLKEGGDYKNFLHQLQVFFKENIPISSVSINQFDQFVLQNQGFIVDNLQDGKDANHM